ncbi:hypothetical protein MSTE_01254 [Mycobacteroides stephanolepidis]|uniref:Uncharacterized protein n=1 Tax=[Mycobacterium] stephanolepidis TaxID=1520670 RepID=A0A1Z4EUH5_9MYCO|nr:hypothetical protein MSTE_01254 [[Mycobacterium] stephanolepidis]
MAVHASKVVPWAGLLVLVVVVDDVLADEENELDEETEPGVGVPWIPPCAHPETTAAEAATTAIHVIFICSSIPNASAGGGWRVDAPPFTVDGVTPELFERLGVPVFGAVVLVLCNLGPLSPRLHSFDVRVDDSDD